MSATATRRALLRSDAVAIGVLIAVAALGYATFPDNLALLTRIVAVAFLVISLDLVTGVCGVATLGHAALFGAGAYTAGIGAAHYGINDPLAMIAAGMMGGAAAGAVCGLVMVRARGLAQLVLSIALVSLFHEAANKASNWTGGSDGLSGIAASPLFGVFPFDLWGRTAYLLAVALLIVTFMGLRVLRRSPFGLLCRAIGQEERRVRAMGASPNRAIIAMYGISGAVAGIGGAVGAVSAQVVGLDSLSFTLSAEALVMLVLGGVGSLAGALTGTVVFMLFEDIVSAASPFHWLIIVGALLILTVLFAPKGVYGAVAARLTRQ